MDIWINEQRLNLPDGATVAEALARIEARPPYAVAVNATFVPRSRHDEHRLREGDRVELVEPMQGG
ncbi:MAG TPA: sulfur carrier protein ThiS [Candidatus Competibacteraceae bacterium]|nr:sulfur carrier protein ThiS [Candidatus Competibacteraceae bacterium]